MHRILPVGVLVYHAYLRIVHSGMSAQEVLGMPDEEFGQFFPQCFQVTCDAALVPYEKDFIPGLALSFTEGFTLAAVGSEDMVQKLFSVSYLLGIVSNRFCFAGMPAEHVPVGRAHHQGDRENSGNQIHDYATTHVPVQATTTSCGIR